MPATARTPGLSPPNTDIPGDLDWPDPLDTDIPGDLDWPDPLDTDIPGDLDWPGPAGAEPGDRVPDWPGPAAAEPGDGAPDWPGPADGADLPGDLAPDWPDLEDAEPAAGGPPGPRLPGPVREVLKAGRWDRATGDGGGFAAGGVADHLPPGSVLAGFAGDAWAGGLGRLTDDELIGVIRAGRRLASWAAALELAAIGDLWRRRVTEEEAGDTGAAGYAGDEVAAALTLTGRAADRVLDLAIALRRLPLTSRALAAGDIDLPKAMVIAREVTGLDGGHAAAVEQAIAGPAAGQTTGQLRAAARRAVLGADPSAARQRKERAEQDARVERWDEHAGTAALAGRDLPPASVLAADQHLTALARQLKAAGVPGTMDTLRAHAFLALLSGTVDRLPGLTGTAGQPAGPSDTTGQSPVFTATAGQSPGLTGLTGAVDHSPGFTGSLDPSPGLSGSVNLTMPLATWLGLSDAPGAASGYGPLDASDSRDLARALAAGARNRWCLTFTDACGRPVAHGCAQNRPADGHRDDDRPADKRRDGDRAGKGPRDRDRPGPRSRAGPSSRTRAGSTGDRWTFTLTLLPGNACDHAWQTPAYQPSRALRHLLEARHGTCVFPGCRRPAAHCDQDHTVPYDQGGKTCLCNLAPLCRRHHRVKQARGWALTHLSPGVLAWTTPSGRHYTA